MRPWTWQACGWTGRWRPGDMRKLDSTKLLRTAVVTAILVCMAVVTAAVARADSEGAGTVTAPARRAFFREITASV